MVTSPTDGLYSRDSEKDFASDKDRIPYLENGDVSEQKRKYIQTGLSPEDADFLLEMPIKQQDAIFRKVDMRVVPMLALLYLIAHLDRANIGNAKIEGIEASLGMTGTDYNVAVCVFFSSYILLEVPSNLLLAKFRHPSYYMGVIVTAWGLVMTFSGLVRNLAGLAATRVLIGAFESGFFPGAIWLISQWYPPYKTQLRTSIFYFSSAFSGAFSGILAAGISQLNGAGGLEGWRWIFILEGIASVLLGVACFFLLPDTPSLSGRWLMPEEIRFLNLIHHATRGSQIEKLAETQSAKKPFNWAVLWQVLSDKHIYLQAFVFLSNTVPNYGLKFTMPQIIKNMGFTSTNAQLLTAPPYFLGAISAVVHSYFADRTGKRAPFLVGPLTLLIIGYSVLFVKAPDIANNIAVCYVMVALICIGVYPVIPGCNTWTVNNLAGAEKRSLGIGWLVTLGNCGGLIASFIYLPSESPQYPTGFGTSLAFAAAGMVATTILAVSYWSHNKKYAGITEEEVKEKWGSAELEKLGDRSPLFRYQL